MCQELGQKMLFDCPHPTDPDFENLESVFFFFFFLSFFLFHCTKEYWPYFCNSWKGFFVCFVFVFVFSFFSLNFEIFCILKREKDCVLEVCIKHVTCFKGTNGRQKTYEISHVYSIFYSGFMCQTTVIFGITKDGSLY